jgi:hypothetical protein
LLRGILQSTWGLSFEEIHVREEVVRATATLETRDELQENSIDSVTETVFIPLNFAGVFLALIQKKGFHDVGSDGISRKIQVTVTESFKDTEASFPETTC